MGKRLVVLLVVVVVTSLVLLFGARRASAPAPMVPVVPAPQPPSPAPQAGPTAPHNKMMFSHGELAARVSLAVERVVGAGRAQSAVVDRPGGGRWVCVVAAEQARYVLFDEGQTAETFSWVKDGGFVEPPTPVAKTMSIYLSVAKRAIDYSAERGDRILVVTCPQEAWGGIPFSWPSTK